MFFEPNFVWGRAWRLLGRSRSWQMQEQPEHRPRQLQKGRIVVFLRPNLVFFDSHFAPRSYVDPASSPTEGNKSPWTPPPRPPSPHRREKTLSPHKPREAERNQISRSRVRSRSPGGRSAAPSNLAPVREELPGAPQDNAKDHAEVARLQKQLKMAQV